MRKKRIPRILQIQLQILLSSVILPHFFFDMIQILAFIHKIKATATANFNTVATIFLLFYMHSINDIRSFLAYSSALNLCYLLIILTINSYYGFTVFLFYLFVYSFYIFNFFAFIFLISNNFL